ncbi:DUF1622 domain-containing protein [Microvirga pudoricolor]|uniref:DUF1622 domain-containing protein n=1 Tax=Microvirga pudoricolor TaxID=2778729 RepID=UPI0019507BD4|nr:DUF1622 domain-containing protein [Microvirga pudoricolor]MBM6592876.1 DUF1622 domain-containing protein [Microvirga pudoricolor]
MDEGFGLVLRWITKAIEFGGIGIIAIGAVAATVTYLGQFFGGSRTDAFIQYRSSLGRAILLGLEFLVAADIINTVAIEPSLESIAVLGGIVLIRTFLSFSLEIEIEGRWPWDRAKSEGAPGPAASIPDARS